MSVRRIASVLTVTLLATATAALAQPKKAPTGPVAPAKEAPAPVPAADPALPPAGEEAGSAVQMAEDPPPSDMEGTNENPDAPKTGDEPAQVVVAPAKVKRTGYPIEEIYRPITLPQNMSEVSLDLHAAVSTFTASGVLRARYGITRQAQLGLTYVFGGIYAAEDFGSTSGGAKFHPGKAVGLDLTVLVQDWIGVRVGVPVYIDPVAVSLQLAAPIKFVFFDKLAIGGLDDLINIKLAKFVPSFAQESQNALAAAGTDDNGNNTIQSAGYVNVGGYAAYQHKPNMAFLLRAGVRLDDFSSTRTDAGDASGATTYLRVGLEYTAKTSVDVGGSLGFDDLGHGGTFGPQFYLAVRI